MGKQLYINNARVLIDEKMYFPFTHTISDLENVNIIGVPATKTISIQRCPQNDEIFGYICEITRINSRAHNNLIGISFNQTKKTSYELYNDSQLISRGIILINDITETSYEITLYDELIQKLEDYSAAFLSDIEYLYDDDLNRVNFQCYHGGVKQMSTDFGIKPVFCINDTDLPLDKIKCTRYTASTSSYTVEMNDLPQECTPLQLKTFKSWDIPYAISLKNTIEAMNEYSGALPDIVVDPALSGLTSSVYLLTNKPKNDSLVAESYNIYGDFSSVGYNSECQIMNKDTSTYFEFKNGNYYMRLNFNIDISVDKIQDNILTKYWNESGVLTTYQLPLADGSYIGTFWMNIILFNDYNSKRYSLNPSLQRVDLYYNVNSTFTLGASTQSATITGTFLLNTDYYVDLITSNMDIVKDGHLRFEILTVNPSNTSNEIELFGESTVTVSDFDITNDSNLEFTPLDFRTGEWINGLKIMPKVSFKDFLITTAKTFNLDISIVDGNFYLQQKKYYLINETPLFDTITSINTANIDFNKMTLTNTLPENDLVKNYEKKYKKIYGEQVINTGYAIKNNEKKINFDAGIPLLVKDTNAFSYDRFTKYYNGGYNKNNHGMINGFEDKIAFGYLNYIDDSIYIVDDIAAEAGINTDSYDELTQEFVQYSPFLIVNHEAQDDSNRWTWLNTTSPYGTKLDGYYTFSPYSFSGNTITMSLDMNKPVVNYANISDADYPVESTAYYRYHRNMIIDKYSANTHLLKVRMFIDGPIDIYKIYNYKNSYYIISKIIEYDPTEPGIYDIELMRVNNLDNYFKYEFVDEDDEPGGDPEPILDLYTYKYKVTNNSSQVVYYSIYFDSETYSQTFNSQLSIESIDFEELTPMEEKSMSVTVTITNPTSLVKIGTVETEGGTYRMACYGETNYLDIDDYEILSESNSQVYGSLNITEDYNNNSIIFEVVIEDI